MMAVTFRTKAFRTTPRDFDSSARAQYFITTSQVKVSRSLDRVARIHIHINITLLWLATN